MDISGQAEVSDLHDIALCDKDVPGGQVSVYTLERKEWERKGGRKIGGKKRGGQRVEKVRGREE